MRFARGDLRTHIDSYKNDHRPSYWLLSTLPLQQCRKNDFREIFGVFRFSTFSTASTHLRHQAKSMSEAGRVISRSPPIGKVLGFCHPT
jgi:hypothetical protein